MRAFFRKAVSPLMAIVIVTMAAHAYATPERTITLNIGDAAPPLKPKTWLKGDPVLRYKRGHVYVIDFWATWCPPCITGIPHLNALQKQHANGLTVVAINVERLGGLHAESGAPGIDFMGKKGREMEYNVALDDPETEPVYRAWMSAAGLIGVPTLFIVNQDGRIAWVGTTMVKQSYSFDEALSDTLAGRTDLARSRALLAAMNGTAQQLH
jgi:thiol-disulfide isomerase/thioredoxin